MEGASRAIRQVLAKFEEHESVADALLGFTRQLELDYATSQDIALFIFALRSFFCWHRAPELAKEPKEVSRIQSLWVEQNECVYTDWLASMQDNPDALTWAKWTFQAKTSILSEFLDNCGGVSS